MLGSVIYAKSFDSCNSDPHPSRRLHCVEYWYRHDDSQILALFTLSISRDGSEEMMLFDILFSLFSAVLPRAHLKPFMLPNLNTMYFVHSKAYNDRLVQAFLHVSIIDGASIQTSWLLNVLCNKLSSTEVHV